MGHAYGKRHKITVWLEIPVDFHFYLAPAEPDVGVMTDGIEFDGGGEYSDDKIQEVIAGNTYSITEAAWDEIRGR